MTILGIIFVILGIVLGVIVAGAIVYALIVFRHEHRWAKIKSEQYDLYNEDKA